MKTSRDKMILKWVEDNGSITIWQAALVFFKPSKYAYDLARKRLKKLSTAGDMQLLKYCTNHETEERIYYLEKRPSSHQVYLNNILAMFMHHDAAVLGWKREQQFMDGKVRCDAFIKYGWNGLVRIACIECDLTSGTDITKYERLYETEELQRQYHGVFPSIIIMSDNPKKYEGKLNVIDIDFRLTKFVQKILEVPQ